jgi:hypothetical protein
MKLKELEMQKGKALKISFFILLFIFPLRSGDHWKGK